MAENIENTLTAYLGVDFQVNLMWQLLVEPEFAEKIIPNLAVEYFDDPVLKRLFIIILEFYKEHDKVPNFQNKTIHLAINQYKTPNNIVEEESLFAILNKINLWNERVINKQITYNGDVIQRSTNLFIKQQEYRKVGEYIIEKTKTGEIKNKFIVSYIEEQFQKISHIGEEKDDSEEVIDNIDHALRKEFRETIPTGIEVIDVLTGGGLGKGEIGIILTPSGVGKTTALTKIANTAYEIGKNVAQIVFEDEKDAIKRKHYTIWSGIPLSKIDDEDENVKVKERVHAKVKTLKGKGRIVIKKFSQEDTTMKDVRNWMISYQKKYGFLFDELVLDYLDCVESHKKTADRTEGELVVVKSFEALASDFAIPCWTAIQSGRAGIGAEIVAAYHTGGSIKRLQKAHFFMSAAKTDDQKEAQLATISIIKARFAQDGQTFRDCVFNNDTMEIRIEDDRYKYAKLYKGQKHHTDEDIDKLESDLNKMHAVASNFSEESLLDKVNSDTINDDHDTIKDLVLDSAMQKFIEQKKTVGDVNFEEIIKEPNIETDDIIINGFEENTDVSNIKLESDIKFEWGFQSNETIIEKEPEPIIVNTVLVEFNKLDSDKNIMLPTVDVETKLIDPDKLNSHIGIHEMLMQERKKQNVMKKEK